MPDTIGIDHIPRSVVLITIRIIIVCKELPASTAIEGIFNLLVTANKPYTGLILAPIIKGATVKKLSQ